MLAKAALGDRNSRHFFAEKLITYYRLTPAGQVYHYDTEFMQIYRQFINQNYETLDRKYTVYQLIQLVLNSSGETAECGAYKGATSYFICHRIQGLGKTHHVFDSFQGLSEPTAFDNPVWKAGHLAADDSYIRTILKDFDFVHYHVGWIPEKFPEVAEQRFCFLHLDLDLYQPTLDSLQFFYERMTAYGIIICDDYGFLSCVGVTSAMDEFFADKPEKIIALPTGQGLVVILPNS